MTSFSYWNEWTFFHSTTMALGIVIWLKLKHEDFGPKLGSDLSSDKPEDFYYFGSELVQKTFPFSLNENAFSIKIVFLFYVYKQKECKQMHNFVSSGRFCFPTKVSLDFLPCFLQNEFSNITQTLWYIMKVAEDSNWVQKAFLCCIFTIDLAVHRIRVSKKCFRAVFELDLHAFACQTSCFQ